MLKRSNLPERAWHQVSIFAIKNQNLTTCVSTSSQVRFPCRTCTGKAVAVFFELILVARKSTPPSSSRFFSLGLLHRFQVFFRYVVPTGAFRARHEQAVCCWFLLVADPTATRAGIQFIRIIPMLSVGACYHTYYFHYFYLWLIYSDVGHCKNKRAAWFVVAKALVIRYKAKQQTEALQRSLPYHLHHYFAQKDFTVFHLAPYIPRPSPGGPAVSASLDTLPPLDNNNYYYLYSDPLTQRRRLDSLRASWAADPTRNNNTLHTHTHK